MVSTLTTHASGPGSIPVAGGQKERLISLLLNLVARIPRKVEVPSTLTLRVEVKEPTEDEKHSGSDHPGRFNHISILLHSELEEEVNCSSQHTWRTIEYDVCDLAIQASTINQSKKVKQKLPHVKSIPFPMFLYPCYACKKSSFPSFAYLCSYMRYPLFPQQR